MANLILWLIGPVAAGCLIFAALSSRSVRALAGVTFRETRRQPIVLIVTAAGALALVLLGTVPLFSLMPREEMALTLELGVSTITLAGLVIALFSATGAVTEEIESRTALVILSRGLRRWEFLIGKYLGVMTTVLASTIIMGLACQAGALWKFTDAYQLEGPFTQNLTLFMHAGPDTSYGTLALTDISSITSLPFHQSWSAIGIIGTALAFCSTAVMASLAIAFSTRLPIAVNAATCLVVYSLGNLIDYLLMQKPAGSLMNLISSLASFLIPNLEIYDVVHALGRGALLPPSFLLSALSYTIIYILAGLFLAYLLFRRRDLN